MSEQTTSEGRSSSRPPLADWNVLELAEWTAGPYCTKLLADLGATVHKVEWGQGDPTRAWGPFAGDPHPERSPRFGYLNTSKESLSVGPDMTERELEALIRDHVDAYDIVVVDQHFLARLRERWLDDVIDDHPRLIVTTVTPYGAAGPHAGYRAYDINVSARGGIAYGVGTRGRAPLPLPLQQAEFHAGMTAAIATLMAALARGRDGLGQHVDHSSTEVLASLHTAFFLPLFVYGGGIVGCRNFREGAIPTYPNGVMPCKDGLFSAASPKIEQWLRFLRAMGSPEWAEQPRYRDRRAMAIEYKQEVDALMMEWTMERTKRDLFDIFLDHRIPCAPIMDGQDLIDNEHLAARDALVEIDLAGGGTFVAPRSPYRFGRTTAEPRPAPRLGSLDELAVARRGQSELPDPVDSDEPPLSGLRVLDLGTAWAGGLAGRFFADYGADVIKVEGWTHMDGSRMGKPLLVDDTAGGDRGEWPNMQAGFHVHSRSKRSITLNLKTDEGRQVFLDLVRTADVVLHNFPRGVTERLGISSDELLAVNPRVIVAGQSVAGADGPASDYIGYAGTVAALSGLGSVIGYDGEEPIGAFQGLYCDVISALTNVLGALVALVEREQSGAGQAVDVSQWEGTMALAAGTVLHVSTTGESLGSVGFSHPLLCPHRMYPTRPVEGDDPESAWLSIAVGSDAEWRGLLAVIGADHLRDDAAGWDIEARRRYEDQIDEAITAWSRQHDRYEGELLLQEAGVAAGAVQNVADMFSDPQLDHRGAFVYLEHPRVGAEPQPGLPWRLVRTPGEVRCPAPDLGADTRTVLIDELGMDPDEYDRLVAAGAVEVGPPTPRR